MKKIILIVGLLLIAAPVMGATPTPSTTPTVTPSVTPTPTPTVTPTPSVTPSVTPTSSVTPTPSVTPTVVPGLYPGTFKADILDIALKYEFTTTVTDQALTNIRTQQAFVVPVGARFYVTDINWSLQSAVVGTLEWDTATTDVTFDVMNAPFTGQGKVIGFKTAITSLDAGISPALTIDRDATGWVYLGGHLE